MLPGAPASRESLSITQTLSSGAMATMVDSMSSTFCYVFHNRIDSYDQCLKLAANAQPPYTLDDLVEMAAHRRLRMSKRQLTSADLKRIPLPSIVHVYGEDPSKGMFLLLLGVNERQMLCLKGPSATIVKIGREGFLRRWSGIATIGWSWPTRGRDSFNCRNCNWDGHQPAIFNSEGISSFALSVRPARRYWYLRWFLPEAGAGTMKRERQLLHKCNHCRALERSVEASTSILNTSTVTFTIKGRRGDQTGYCVLNNDKFYYRYSVPDRPGHSGHKQEDAFDGRTFYSGAVRRQGTSKLAKYLGDNPNGRDAANRPIDVPYLYAAGFRLPMTVAQWTGPPFLQSVVLQCARKRAY